MTENFKVYAQWMKVLSDETRFKIYRMLADGELCACRILEEFNITQPTLSYHMKLMCDSGLVKARRDGIWMRYSINRDSLEALRNILQGICVRFDIESVNENCICENGDSSDECI